MAEKTKNNEIAVTEELRARLPKWPIIHTETAELLKEVYLSGKWSFNGPYERRFSKAFARMHTAKHGIFMANGTVTLQCALQALGVKAGDEVIVPGLTWMATAMSILYVGATPVFVDIDPETLCLDPEKVKKAITTKTKAIIPVHIYGSMADMEAMMAISEEYGVKVIEDCAHAHGGIWDGKGVGSVGHIGSFSFQESKTLASGEGGICLTNDEDLAETLFRLKHIGYDLGAKQGNAGTPPPEGLVCHNYRGTEFQGAVLLGNLQYLQDEAELRAENAGTLRELMKDIDGVELQKPGRLADLQGYYSLGVIIDDSKLVDKGLDDIREALTEEGLPIGKTYGPVYDHALWSAPKNTYRKEDCSVCDDLCANKVLCLSQAWLLTDAEVMEAIAEAFRRVLGK
ncbi:MAG: DegT/DnrJ/EryC1/StrS family aminotransferase [Victivallales bacterium]|nr:DegT/DnrJ/EryC1/StrS family aminotransferase [Victivallales bacterium]